MPIESTFIIDVRELEEFRAEHIPNSVNIPLSKICENIPEICKNLNGKKIVFVCQSGARAKKALEIWSQNSTESASVFEGGLFQWKLNNGLVVKNKLSIMQQVQLSVGIMILTFSLLTYTTSVYFLIPIFILGIGLSFAGLTGFCGLARVLSKMPWNSIKS